VVVQSRVTELVDRADGTQQPKAVSGTEEAHDSPGKPVLEGQPGHRKRADQPCAMSAQVDAVQDPEK
jgi:hypothetical protein